MVASSETLRVDEPAGAGWPLIMTGAWVAGGGCCAGITEEEWSGRRGSNSQLSAWESKVSLLYFQYLQNSLGKINVHATHTVHAVPELRVAGGRLGDDFRARFRL